MKKQIVMVESSPIDLLAKLSFVLKKKGYETVLISLTGNVETEFLQKSYDQRIGLNLKYVKISATHVPSIIKELFSKLKNVISAWKSIRKLNPYVVIGRSNPSWMVVFFRKVFFRKNSVVYFPYDIRSSTYEDKKETKKLGIPNFEFKAERYCFENCDGVMHKGHRDELKRLNEKLLGKNVKIKGPELYFFPYCLQEFIEPIDTKNKLSKKDGSIHLVFTGAFGVEPEWLEAVRHMIKQKIHLHVYGKIGNLSEKEQYKAIEKGYGDIMQNEFFHLHGRVDQKILAKEISKYDYGIFSLDKNHKSVAISTGNKFSSYLEAGIPILNLKHFEALAEIIDQYKIGLNVDFNDLDKLRKLLEKNKVSTKNIERARKVLSIRNNLPRLEEFFSEVKKK